MKIQKIEKDGQVLTTKDGVELKEYTFEVGDTFVPQQNKIFERTNQANVRGEQKLITKYKLPVIAKDLNGNKIEDGNEIWVTLTPTQAKSIQKKIDNDVLINQNMFTVYEYENNFGTQIGVGIKSKQIPPKTFEELENEM